MNPSVMEPLPHGLRHTMAYELPMKDVVLHPGSLMSCAATQSGTPLAFLIAPKQVLEVMSGRN